VETSRQPVGDATTTGFGLDFNIILTTMEAPHPAHSLWPGDRTSCLAAKSFIVVTTRLITPLCRDD
ncbi:MAG: hypothetical protein ABH838_01680, partial [Actinomycetota bacterium]